MNMKTLTETSTFRVLSLLLCFCFFIPAMNVSALMAAGIVHRRQIAPATHF